MIQPNSKNTDERNAYDEDYMKRISLVLIGCLVSVSFGYLMTKSVNAHPVATSTESAAQDMTAQKCDVAVGGNITAPHDVDYESDDYDLFGGFSEEDIDLMAAIVYWEAGNQDFLGKCYVVDSMLNRLDDARFPDSIKEIASAPKQYSTYQKAQGTEDIDIPIECYGAVINEVHNRTNSQVLYFSSEGYNGPTHLFKYGNHYFSC